MDYFLDMFFIIKQLILNAIAHYTIKNRIEYLKLIIRLSNPLAIDIAQNNRYAVSNTYIISLEKDSLRREAILKHLIAEKHSFRFIRGILGKPTYYSGIPISKRSYHYLKPGSIGCWLSHYKAWTIALTCNSEYTLIFEDDVVLIKNFYCKLNSLIKFIPKDFDILYLDSGNRQIRNMRTIINNTIFIPYQIRNGSYAYILSIKGTIKLLELIPKVKVTRGGIDSAIGVLIRNKSIVAYHLLEKICQVDFSFESSTK